jgi:hypothetical protein
MRASIACATSRSLPAAIVGAWVAVGVPAAACANVIIDWDEKAVAVVMPGGPAGVTQQVYTAQRTMGMVHTAMFDTVNSIERRYRPYLVQLPTSPTTSKEAAAAAAAAAVLGSIDEKTAGEMKGALASYLASMPEGESKSDGIRLGEAVAARSSPRGQTTAPMHPMPTVQGPHLASTCRRRSLRPRCGRT